jgi:hypothetical protein
MFRQTTGFTPHQHISHRRVERARQLLVDTDLPLAESAHRCGFSSQSQFTTVFRRLTDITPARFRAEYAPPDKALLTGTKDASLPANDSGTSGPARDESHRSPQPSRLDAGRVPSPKPMHELVQASGRLPAMRR